MTPELCNHVNVDRKVIAQIGIHCICKDCFEEWVE